ncbi:hypothetical protein ACHAWO_005976 [Cyclotella atomus]|uniref:J domain-containing protein n=1 Tax=Cyclotella atomus TaxID=382360 RepID=A0ABD3PCR5_9STRA
MWSTTTAKPTPLLLLSLVNLPADASESERAARITTLKSWIEEHPSLMSQLLSLQEYRDKKTGCMSLHWAAGTGFDEAVELLLNVDLIDNGAQEDVPSKKLPVDQEAYHPSTSRTALHYAARNGHLSTCQLLISKYGADSHPKCGRGAVTPIQLAVWQNRLSIVKYLVDVNAERGIQVAFERNGFSCGLMHWLGLVPAKRWSGDLDHEFNNSDEDDGSGVLPLARYLHSLGISYESTPENCNAQGHTPNHKAAWGGNLALIKYFRDEHGVYDTIQDEAGNYCADIARMRGNMEVHQWLLEHGSGDRAISYKTLGLEVGASMDAVKRRYWDLARAHHPDKKKHQTLADKDCNYVYEDNDFIKIKAAYEHLTKQHGIGQQKNPKYDDVKLLENKLASSGADSVDDDLFIHKMLAIISDYGEDGFPVSLISRRWNQIWPDRPFPTLYIIEYQAKSQTNDGLTVQKKVNLLRFLKWRCKGSSISFRDTERGVVLVNNAKSRQQ